MQKVSYNTRSHARLPLLDLTNIRANEHLMSKPLATSKNESRSGISNFLVPSCAIDLARCSHASTIKSVSASASNCADCGALVTSEGVCGIVKEGKSSRISISPSLLVSKMVEKQHTNRPCYKSPPPALILSRKRTLDWLCETGESLGISSECIHKSAVFFDRILSENMIEEAELQSIALMCLLLSCKLIEKDQETDKVKSLFRSRMGVRGYQLKQRETRVLTLLRWDLQCVTPLDFLEIFFSQGILFTNDRIRTASGNKQVNVKVAESLRKYAEFFAELCLQKHALLSVDSLHLAAGILAVSRKRMGLVDTWSKETEMLTGVKLSEIADCVETIERFYTRMFPGTRVSREANSRPAREARDTDKYFAKGRDKENLNNAWGYRTVRVPSALTMYSTADSGKYGKQW